MDRSSVEPLAAELRQQRRVNVEDPAPIGRQCVRAQQFHVSGQTDERNAVLVQGAQDGPVQLLRIGMGAAAEVIDGDAGTPTPGHSAGLRVVADDDARLRLERAGAASGKNRGHIGTASGGEKSKSEIHRQFSRRSLHAEL